MCKPAVTRTLQPGVTSTSLVWNGPKRNDSTLRIEIRNGFAGKESARISAHKLPRWFHFGVRWDGWLGLSESCGGRQPSCVFSVFGGGTGGDGSVVKRPDEPGAARWGRKESARR